MSTRENIRLIARCSFEPKKPRAYVCMKISEYPPPPWGFYCTIILVYCRNLSILAGNAVHNFTVLRYSTIIHIDNNSFTLCLFHAFLSSANFQNQVFKRFFSRILFESQTVWIQIRPDVLSGLIRVQSIC